MFGICIEQKMFGIGLNNKNVPISCRMTIWYHNYNVYNPRPLISYCITCEMSNFVRAKQHHLSEIYYIKRFDYTQNSINSMTPRIISKDLHKKTTNHFRTHHPPSICNFPLCPRCFPPSKVPARRHLILHPSSPIGHARSSPHAGWARADWETVKEAMGFLSTLHLQTQIGR